MNDITSSQARSWRALFAPLALILMGGLLAASGCVRGPAEARQWQYDREYKSFARLLARHVADEGVDYAAIAAEPSDLKIAKRRMEAVTEEEFRRFTEPEQLAFLVNAHNLYAIDRVVQDYPVRSIESTSWIGSARNDRDIRLVGRKWSLADLQREITGPRFYDARAIFLLNPAMEGFPPLADVPATAGNIETLLDYQTRRFVQNEQYNRHERRDRIYYVSPLIEEYREDINRDFATLWAFFEFYLGPDEANYLRAFPPRFRFTEISRGLNDASATAVADSR